LTWVNTDLPEALDGLPGERIAVLKTAAPLTWKAIAGLVVLVALILTSVPLIAGTGPQDSGSIAHASAFQHDGAVPCDDRDGDATPNCCLGVVCLMHAWGAKPGAPVLYAATMILASRPRQATGQPAGSAVAAIFRPPILAD
jgi:hypothetical protein